MLLGHKAAVFTQLRQLVPLQLKKVRPPLSRSLRDPHRAVSRRCRCARPWPVSAGEDEALTRTLRRLSRPVPDSSLQTIRMSGMSAAALALCADTREVQLCGLALPSALIIPAALASSPELAAALGCVLSARFRPRDFRFPDTSAPALLLLLQEAALGQWLRKIAPLCVTAAGI